MATVRPPSSARQTQLDNADRHAAIEAADHAAEGFDTLEDVDRDFDPEEMEMESLGESVSLTSSIYQHCYRHGRRYHMYRLGRYPLPNDDDEQNREDMGHAMMLEMLNGKLFFAPIGDHPQKIIDLGTGTGIWAIEVGAQFPSAEVMGVDLSPIQPLWVPPNVRFYVDDIEDEWLNGSNYDLVHARHVLPFLKDVPGLLRRAYEHLKPGGWVEMQDLDHMAFCDDGTMPPTKEEYPVLEFLDMMGWTWGKLGTDVRIAPKLGDMLREAGFIDIRYKVYKVPLGVWPENPALRLVGLYLRMVIEMVVPAMYSTPPCTAKWSDIQREVFIANCRSALKDTSIHSYMMHYFWYAQKPSASGRK